LGVNALSISGGGAGAPSLVFNNYAGSPVSGPNKIKLFGDSNTLGFGIDASTLDYHSPSMHRWNIGSVIGAMTLNYSGGASNLNVNGNITASGDVKGGTRLCIGTDCRTAWPAGGSGGSGGTGDNLGNHIATQDLEMTSGNGAHSIRHANVIQGNSVVTPNLIVDGVLKFSPTGGVPSTNPQKVLTLLSPDGTAIWGNLPAAQPPQFGIFGPFYSVRSAPPVTQSIAGNWDFCALTGVFNDGGSDNAPAIGCQLNPLAGNAWSIDVFGATNDQTQCNVMCVKF
jgi:hypothetical protein